MMDSYRANLQRALALAGEGRVKEGLELLQDTLDAALAAERLRLIPALARNAALLCEFSADIERAIRYAKLAHRYSPVDSSADLLLLGRLFARSGDRKRARYWYGRCRKISMRKDDTATLELLAQLSSHIDDGP